MDVVQLLGVNVRIQRKLKGMSQEELALEAGMERSYVSDLERGQRNPSVRALGRLADALGIEPKVLWTGKVRLALRANSIRKGRHWPAMLATTIKHAAAIAEINCAQHQNGFFSALKRATFVSNPE